MILLNLTSPTKPAAAPPPPLRKGVVVQQTLAVPAEPLRHLWCSGAARCSRLKIQARCRPPRHTLPDPKDVDAQWSIQQNVPNRVAKSDATDHRTSDLDVVL